MIGKRKYVLIIILLLLTFSSLCTYSSDVENLMIDIFSHFKIQYAFIFFAISVYYFLRKKFLLLSVFLLLFLMNILTSWEINNRSAYASTKNDANLKIYSANIYKDNKSLSNLISEIKRETPQIALFIEVRPHHLNELTTVIHEYRYMIFDPKMYTSHVGMVFLSTFPIVDCNIINLSEHGNAIIRVRLKVNGKDVVFYGVHLPRIGIDRNFRVRQKIFTRLASMISTESMPVIIAGDFNTTPYSPIFRRFIEISKLSDSSKDYGWYPTWPAFFPPLWIPIDHILVSQEIHIVNKDRGSYIGSDHYPIMANLSLR